MLHPLVSYTYASNIPEALHSARLTPRHRATPPGCTDSFSVYVQCRVVSERARKAPAPPKQPVPVARSQDHMRALLDSSSRAVTSCGKKVSLSGKHDRPAGPSNTPFVAKQARSKVTRTRITALPSFSSILSHVIPFCFPQSPRALSRHTAFAVIQPLLEGGRKAVESCQ